ncbi:hypothetical protein SLS58_009345 [Diplodia intermedia]|uniref:Uncharacterized protein n=1 Tax=Diplodia intermedia TaxID=856260 RepID=A0ABR3TDA7_9PEZI
MALLDVAESPVVDDTLRQEARTIRDSFSQTLLADTLVHWSPDEPAAVIVLLPISDRAFLSDDRDAQPPLFLLRFDFDVSTLALNQHTLQSHPTTAAAPPFAVSARRIHPANASTLEAADLWSLSTTTTTTTTTAAAAADRHPLPQHDVYTVAVHPTLSPPPSANTTTLDSAFPLTFDITAAQPAPANDNNACSSLLLRHTRLLLPARLHPGDCVASRPPPVIRLDDPAQLVVQIGVPDARRIGEGGV